MKIIPILRTLCRIMKSIVGIVITLRTNKQQSGSQSKTTSEDADNSSKVSQDSTNYDPYEGEYMPLPKELFERSRDKSKHGTPKF